MKRNLLACLLFATCLAALPLAGQSADGTDPVLNAGDAIRITVWRQPELSGEFWIAVDSTLRHPLYRDVTVGGVPASVAESRLRTYLSQLEANPRFVIEPLLRVAVGGEVRQPNLYTLPPEVTVAQAVVQAGGLTERGRPDQVLLVRGRVEYRVDLTSAEFDIGQTPVQSGDRIIVGAKRNYFREYVVPGATLTAALAAVADLLMN